LPTPRKITFFPAVHSPTLSELAVWTGATLADEARAQDRIADVAAIDAAGPGDLTFLDNPRYLPQLKTSRAAAVFVQPRHKPEVPAATAALVTPQPYVAMALAMAKLFPSAARPASGFEERGVSAAAHVHASARLEPGVVVDPGAVVGPGAEIGSGTVIGANAVIGAGVRIGRDCAIGPAATLACALIGDRVIIHSGAHIGQDGYGFALSPRGHIKVPQIGRVVIQDDVEIGAGSTIDRGANRDTIIGEGTKIDNLVQIGHNVVIGRHCIIVSQVGISGSCVIDDFVALGGQVGLAGHLHIGAGAQVGAASGVMNDIPAGQRWFGVPAQPAREHFRDIATLRKLSRGEKTVSATEKD
jgi:UDP-3-O-[3-hydroxymyristoyl] glucosamine N-acyltransferase